MTTANLTTQLRPSQQPRLPAAPVEYDQRYVDSTNSILRQYFNQVDNLTQNLLTNTGGRFLRTVLGSFYDTTTQTAASTTAAYAITFNTTDISNAVTVASNSRITFTYPGIYNLQFSVQLENNDPAAQDIDIWFAKNGTNISNSNSRFGLAPRKSVGDPYHTVGALNFFVQVTASDYVELYWCTTNTAAKIVSYAAGVTPTRPAVPSVILTATFVSGPLT